MIKQFFIALAAALALPMAAQAQGRIGVVDLDSVRAALPQLKEANEQLQATSAQFEEEYCRLTDEINKKIQEYQALPRETAPAIRERRQQEIQDLDQRIQAFQQKAQNDLAAERRRAIGPVEERISEVIAAIGTEKGFTLIQPKSQTLFIGPDAVDLTQTVIDRLTLL